MAARKKAQVSPEEIHDDSNEHRSSTLRAFNIVEFIAKADQAVSLTDVMHSVDLPKPTVYRILTTLEEAGVLIRDPDGKRYAPGERLAKLAGDVLLRSPHRAARHAILEEVVEQIGETCNLTMPNGSHVMYLDRVETAWPLKVQLHAGSKVPLYASASGKLFLAYMPKRNRDRIIHNTPLIKHTKTTLSEPRKLDQELTAIRRNGWASDNEEYLPGICCLAVPIMTDDDKVLAALAVHAPTSRMDVKKSMEYLKILQDAAERIAESLDWA